MEEENKKIKKSMSNKSKRLLLLGGITLISLSIGGCIGVDITVNSSVKETTSDDSFSELASILKKYWYSEIYYGEDCDEDVIIRQFVGALSTSDSTMLDPYTYLTKNEESAATVIKGKLGITLQSYYNYPVIMEVDSRGNSVGKLKVGDIVVSVTNDKESKTYSVCKESDYLSVFQNALGYEGDTVTVKVARNVEGKLQYVDEQITLGAPLDTLYAYTSDDYSNLYNDNDTLMVKLTSFVDGSNGTAPQLADILSENTDKKNLILDLRNNGGGALSAALDICDLFLPKDTYLSSLLFKDGSTSDFYTSDDDKYDFDNIIILQNGNTASASEFLISVLTYYFPDTCTLVGTKSYGKGIAQRTYQVFDGAYTLQYTCAKWLRPDKSWIGMTVDSTSTIGFYPEDENMVTMGNALKAMETYNGYIYYKDESQDSYLGFQDDKVYYTNEYFFKMYNTVFGTDVRTDRYYDESCAAAIKDYQTLKGIDATGIVSQDTFVYFVKDFYDARLAYSDEYLKTAKLCLN